MGVRERPRTAAVAGVEPSALLTLRWGTWRGRSIAGAMLIIGGLIGLQAANTDFLLPLIWGTAAHTIGWWIMPSDGWRRHVVVFPAGVQIWLLLTGPQSMWTLAIPLACWLLVRHRPWRSWIVLLFVVGNGILMAELFSEYSAMLPALGISLAVVVASAWMARTIAGVGRIPSRNAARVR